LILFWAQENLTRNKRT